ncbi:PLD nuclease N-terminal domain-containing protein [Arthrobacter russicus]|uniref:Cardiolipin synthase N-terminal domain-containing protein n=1 Tax=Arthrobacter russicus TaxID=172040 RepID=A0ABU1JCQ0_9MICC|nr:PLD nuclease N-terminal domain-containing protein [Arthrobacter russicus]MDR6270202.1 hypothetical protein [Arthrobacter russicus]
MLRYVPLLIIVGLELFALIDCLRSERADVRTLPKSAWVLIIILLPIVGLVLWFTLGRPRYNAAGPAARPAVLAPDDDPEFLRNLDVARRQRAEEERLEKLRRDLEERERKLRDQDS